MLDYVPLVGTGIKQWVLGGTEPGQVTLLNFYALHTAILPALLLFVLPFHFWRIRKANGLVVPRSPEEDRGKVGPMVDAMPHLIVREVTTAVVVLAVVLIFSMLVNAPLSEQANPGLSPNPTKAPWYFMGLQELLMHFHPLFSVVVIPVALLAGIIVIPYVGHDAQTSGVWFRSGKGRKMVLLSLILAVAATVSGVLMNEFIINAGSTGPANAIKNGLLPVTIIVAICAGFYLLVMKAFKANHSEAIQALFTLLVTAFVVLTTIGVWFRGAGMQLVWAG
jgi:quinol-cytochrome oxidoreductase complex cytochrome b subunit